MSSNTVFLPHSDHFSMFVLFWSQGIQGPDEAFPQRPTNALEPLTLEGELARVARTEDEQFAKSKSRTFFYGNYI